MGKLFDWTRNKEQIKIAIMDYANVELDIINYSEEYRLNNWKFLRSEKDKKDNKILTDREFNERLYKYLWIPKVSELIIIIYLEDIKNIHPTIYEINRLLNRTSIQYSATFKEVEKLEELHILRTELVKDAKRKDKRILINKEIATIYSDDEFRQMMLDEWNTDAKEYTKRKLEGLLKDKKFFEENIKRIKKGKRQKK